MFFALRSAMRLRFVLAPLLGFAIAIGSTAQEPRPQHLTPLDLFIIVDESGSWTNREFQQQKEFVFNLANEFTFATTLMNAGAATMGTTARLVTDLTADKVRFLNSVNALAPAGGGSNLLPSLNLVHGRLQGSTRPNYEKAIVFISDGAFVEHPGQIEAKINELGTLGYHLFPIAVGANADPYMSTYTRNGGTFFRMSDISSATSFVDPVAAAIAQVPEPSSGLIMLAVLSVSAGCRRAGRYVSAQNSWLHT